ncbi:MAG TPA: YihY/virulence factor BrkB family protein [Syntrophales bacterium]|nr:YihY/virulence factor BrkB family protein [Syntrophales bacterium]
MAEKIENLIRALPRFVRFVFRVVRSFRHNQGMLLSGAIAFYTLLSIAPLTMITLIIFSHFVEEEQLFLTLSTYLEMAMPGYASTLLEQVRTFLTHRNVIGFIGILIMLFFSSIAFTVLENAISVIFHHRIKIQRRHFVISAIIPYMYIVLIGLGIFFVTFFVGALEAIEKKHLMFLGLNLSLRGAPGIVFYWSGLIGEVLMFTSLYLVMPVGRITFRHALSGGLAATVLWEITRRIVVWYYTSVSFVNVIYGSLASTVVFLLGVDAAALILLLGAQVIAELESRPGDVKGEDFRFWDNGRRDPVAK